MKTIYFDKPYIHFQYDASFSCNNFFAKEKHKSFFAIKFNYYAGVFV